MVHYLLLMLYVLSLSFSKKITFFMLSIWYCNWCLMIFFQEIFFSHPLQLPVHFFGMLQDMFCNFLLKDIPFLYSVHVIAKDVSSLFSKVFHMFHMFYHLMIVELLNFFLSPCSLAMRFMMFYSFLYKIYVYWPNVKQTYT